MADYRKSLMDMTPEERAEVAPGFVPSDNVSTPLSVKVADEAVSLATPIDSIVEIQEELKKENPDYLKIGMLGGVEAISLLAPGAGKAAQSMIRKGADLARQTDSAIDVASNVPKVAKEPFKKTRPAYRIATQSADGKLYPLFVNADDEIPVGTWVDAKMPPIMFRGANGNMYAPSKGAKREPDRFYLDGEEITKREYNKLGPNSKPYAKVVRGEKEKPTGDLQVIPDEETANALKEAGFQVEKPSKTAPFGKVRSVAARPGFHATTKPVAHHLGPEDLVVSEEEVQTLLKAGITPKAFKHKTFRKLDGKTINKDAYKKLSPEDKARVEETKKYYVKRRAEDQVFVEVDMADDTSEELAAYMKERGRTDINDKLPEGGSYSYVDGQADGETWVVGGNMRVNKVLSREEAKAAQEAAGVKDLPYRDEVEAILGRKFAEGGLVGEDMYTGQQDYLLAASSGIEMNEGGAVPDNTVGVDPVSGNEVPIGSLPEEVRDDIPAQLSEGEYVVPADVVRYYGVKFFEDLRAEAKQGWAAMEANGRVGGEPVEVTGMEMGQDELPFDISELQVVEMNEGGYLGGYDEGGDVNNFDTPSTSPTGNPFATNTISTKKYVDGQGNVRYVTFSGGTPLSYIPPEFKEEGTQEEAPTTEAAPVQQDDGPDIDYDRYETMRREANKFDPANAAFEDYQREMDKASGKVGSAIAGGIVSTGLGPFVGYGVSKLIDSQNRKKLEQLQKDADARAQAAKETEDLDAMNQFSGLSQEIGNILEGKETKKPSSIGELLGFASKNETGIPTENKSVFSSMLDSIKTGLSEATSWDDDKWRKTGLSEEFSTLKGRDPNRSALWGSEQEALAGAIRSGNDDVVRHYEIINEHRKAAERYRQGKSTGNVMLSQRTMDRIDKEEAEKNKNK